MATTIERDFKMKVTAGYYVRGAFRVYAMKDTTPEERERLVVELREIVQKAVDAGLVSGLLMSDELPDGMV